MAGATYFVRQCPTCGRNLQVRLEYMGREVVCQHCHAAFVANISDAVAEIDDASTDLLHRADELIAAAARSANLPRGG